MEEENIKLQYTINKKVHLSHINERFQDGYHMSETERFVLERLNNSDLKEYISGFNSEFNSENEALLFISDHKKDLQGMELVILTELRIPYIY